MKKDKWGFSKDDYDKNKMKSFVEVARALSKSNNSPQNASEKSDCAQVATDGDINYQEEKIEAHTQVSIQAYDRGIQDGRAQIINEIKKIIGEIK